MIDFNALPQVVAIVGTREWPEAKNKWIQMCIDKLNPRTLVVSGEARGVDTLVKTATLRRKQKQKDIWYKPMECTDGEWELFGRVAGHQRNEDIVLFLRKHKGHMIIFTFQEHIDAEKGGSFNDVEWCEMYGVPYTLITI